MSRLVEYIICGFGQFVALVGVLIGTGFVRPWIRQATAVLAGQPGKPGELARLTACVAGPVGIGLAVFAGLSWYLVVSHRMRRRMADFPGAPWMWRTDWAEKRVRLSNKASIAVFALALTFYALVLLPLGIYLASLKNAGLVYSFLGVVGVFLLIFFRLLWVNRVWNRSELQLESLPGFLGGTFSAVVRIPETFAKEIVFQTTLKCELTQSTGYRSSGGGDLISLVTGTKTSNRVRSDSRTSTVWESQPLLVRSGAAEGPALTVLPVAFDIPPKLPPTGTRTLTSANGLLPDSKVMEHHRWIIRVKLPGATDLREVGFDVPVFARPSGPNPSTPGRRTVE